MRAIRNLDLNTLDFAKGGGLLPVIIQDEDTLQVLMQAFMNRDALVHTMQSGRVTFFSRSKNRLWTKGETSGNYLFAKEILSDCDNDCLLIKVNPKGPACHTGTTSCFDAGKPEEVPGSVMPEATTSATSMQSPSATADPAADTSNASAAFLNYLESMLRERRHADPEKSYTAKLFNAGIKRIAKKMGEEAVELILESEHGQKEQFTEEAADLVYHLTVLMIQKETGWNDIIAELKKRHG